jgi:hypothetical protein
VASPGFARSFWLALLLNTVWMNLSEVFRYFVFVRPLLSNFLAMVPGIAPDDPIIVASWMLWDTILIFITTVIVWVHLDRVGNCWKHAVLAGTFVWVTVFGLFWLAMLNLGLTNGVLVAIALPLAWVELVIAAMIVRWCVARELSRHQTP